MPDLPPHHHATLGAWEIRCSHVGARQRCALIRAEAAADGQSTGSIVSHFVIDAVAGREIVLWRVVVARPEIAAGAIAVNVAATTVHQSYSQCLDNGCIMESGVAISAKVASQLWHGAPVSIQLEASPGASVFVLPALGFREGLAELTRLRHDDRSFTVIRQAP